MTQQTSSLRFRQRWTPWWLAVPILGVYLVFGGVLLWSFHEPGQQVRVILPAYLILGILVLPATLNSRIINVGSHGVKVTNGPFPRGRKVDVARDDIWACNVRVQHTAFSSRYGKTTWVPNYLVGIETRNKQIDVAYPYLKVEEARKVVERMAAALNADRSLRAIPITNASFEPDTNAGWRIKVLAWLGVFLLAVLAGGVWESY